MLDFIKNKIIKAMLGNWIKGLLSAFKQKNPTMWIVVAALLTSAQVVIEKLLATGAIPASADWVQWIVWVIGLLLGSGGVVAYENRQALRSGEIKPEKLTHLSIEDKYSKVLDRNKKLEEIIQKA